MNPHDDAVAVWKAGVQAVGSEHLVEQNVTCTADELNVCGQPVPLVGVRRIEVVGAGKAGAGMARGLLHALRPLRSTIAVDGWVNVPEDCVERLEGIHLHPARPAGINEPTAAGVAGTREILNRVSAVDSEDLCIVLISGGGSALLPAPVPEITLHDKLVVTRLLAGHGAPIEELNVVRSQLSLVKGGGLLQHCTAKRMLTLIISDVIGDPLDIIASAPTTAVSSTAADAISILAMYDPHGTLVPPGVWQFLKNGGRRPTRTPCPGDNFIVGSNSVALAGASREAEKRGYTVLSLGSDNSGAAAEHGRRLFDRLTALRDRANLSIGPPVCLLAGGETTVRLADTTQPRQGGRNQEVVLGAIAAHQNVAAWRQIVLLSGGTDGEDGPTDAAGAIAGAELVAGMRTTGLLADRYLAINNSYAFFDSLGGLLRTGPTHTNVMDLAVGIVSS